MSNKTNQESNSQAVPFFARFLEAQKSQELNSKETLKYPSDSEDVTTEKYPSDYEDG